MASNLLTSQAAPQLQPGQALEDVRAEVERSCLNCPVCQRECAFLQDYGKPGEIAAAYALGEETKGDLPFECSLCGLCEAVCPQDVPVVDFFLEMRRHALAREPERLAQYGPLLTYEKLGASRLFSCYALPQGCDTVFFPGCALSGTRSDAVWEVFQQLRQSNPSLGMVLDCCAKPSHDLGHTERFETLFYEMRDYLVAQGVQTVLVACPNCLQVFSRYGEDLAVKTVYEFLVAQAEPLSGLKRGVVTIHDPCVARWEGQIHGAVRKLVLGAGLRVEEMAHSGRRTLCCGEGGAVGFVRPQLAEDWQNRRKNEAGDRPIVTYCAGCAEKLGKKSRTLHVLDVTLDPRGALQKESKPLHPLVRYWNRLHLKRRIKNEVDAAVSRERRVKLAENPKKGGVLPKLVLLALIIGAVVALRLSGATEYLDPQRLKSSIAGYGMLAPVLFVGIYAVAPVLFLPGLPLTILAGILFGPLWGVVYAIVGATIGATLAFLVARYLGRDWIERKLTGSKLERLDQEVERHGWKVVAFTRLIPLFPFNMLNYAFGLTRIKLLHYVVATFVCMLPACIAFIVFSSSLLDVLRGNISPAFVIGLILIAAVSLAPVVYQRRKKAQDADTPLES